MAVHPARVQLTAGDIATFDGRQVQLLERKSPLSDYYEVVVNGSETEWHVDRIDREASRSRHIQIIKLSRQCEVRLR